MGQKASPLIVIVGETASGKSALAIQLAKQFNGEIICADSWTVRRGVNIGTAKPSQEEQATVPHHLLDVVGPAEDFTAAVFKKLAEQAIDDVANRGKLPIMVGGTGLYIDGVIYDFSFLPAGGQKLRRELNSLTIPQLLKRIEDNGLDVGEVDIRNKRRLIRLIENNGRLPTKHPLRENTLLIGLRTNLEVLKNRIEQRVNEMINDGLETEARELVERYGWDCEALKGIGYSQWRGYFEGRQGRAETHQKIIKATLNLAKRQRTWFKRNKSIHWISSPVNWQQVVDLVTTFLES